MQPKPDIDHSEVNAIARQLCEKYEGRLPFEAFRRSALRNWPEEHKYIAEIDAKLNRPCVVGVQMSGSQGDYVRHIQKHFYPVERTLFPFFAEEYDEVPCGDVRNSTWGEVRRKLNDPSTPMVHWMCFNSPIGVVPSIAHYENLYEKLVLRDGVRDVLGFVHSCDGTLPFGDYIALRQMGVSVEEAAARMGLAASTAESDLIARKMAEEEDGDDKWLIAEDMEAAQREAGSGTGSSQTSFPTPPPPRRVSLSSAGGAEDPAHQSQVYRSLHLFNNDPATAMSWRENKATMHRRLAEVGLDHIRSIESDSADDAIARMAEAELDYPVIVKPVSGAGSEFVTLCPTETDVRTAFKVCEGVLTTQRTAARRMVVEEYIEGQEYVVNLVSFEGVTVVTDVWRSWKYPQTNVSTRLRQSMEKKLKDRAQINPSVKLPEEVESTSLLYDRLEFVDDLGGLDPSSDERAVAEYAIACCKALGMVNGCSHCELRIDERPDSVKYGRPVLIELNPRVQGDAPRATQLVGYDQYTLVYYLSAVAAAYTDASPHPLSPVTLPRPREAGGACSLPWPPVPTLYRYRLPTPPPGEEFVTRHVVFLSSPWTGVLNGLGVRRLKSLPTVLRVTRATLFTPPSPTSLLSVGQTVDLYSSPGAIVFEGPANAIREDTALLRQMEVADFTDDLRVAAKELAALSEQSMSITVEQRDLTTELRSMESQLAGVVRRAEALSLADATPTSRDDGRDSEEELSSSLSSDSTEETLSSLQRRRESLRSSIVQANRKYVELGANRARIVDEIDAMRSKVIAMLTEMDPPPLFTKMDDFHALCNGGIGARLCVERDREAEEMDPGEALVAVKDPRLKAFLNQLTGDGTGSPAQQKLRVDDANGAGFMTSWRRLMSRLSA